MKTLKQLAPHAHWLLRLALASVFLYHGSQKLMMGIGGFAEMMNVPVAIATLVALAELAGGALLILGGLLKHDIMTRLGGLAITPVMLGAITMVHWGQWNFVPSETHPMGGMEMQVALLAVALYFVVVGNGCSGSNCKNK